MSDVDGTWITRSRNRRSMLGLLGGGAAMAAYGAAQIEPAFADWDDDIGPNFVEVVNVQKFGKPEQVVGHGRLQEDPSEDDTDAIEAAIAASRIGPQRPVYFPAGTYLISRPIDVSGCHLIGEVFRNHITGESDVGSTIAAHPRFHGKPVGDGVPLLFATQPEQPLFIDGFYLDARDLADFCLLGKHLHAVSMLQNIRFQTARLDALSVADSQGIRVLTTQVDAGALAPARHGMRFVDCDGSLLHDFNIGGYGRGGDGSSCGILVEGSDAGGGMVIFDGAIEPVFQGHHGTALKFRNVRTPGYSAAIYFESAGSDGVVLESSSYQVVANCTIGGGGVAVQGKVQSPSFGLPFHLTGDSNSNVVRSNMIGWDLGDPLVNQTTTGESPNDRVAIGPECSNNHILDNLSQRNQTSAADPVIRITYPDGDVPTHRNHTLGQPHVMTYAPRRPTFAYRDPNERDFWKVGDIVWNSKPRRGDEVGWICVQSESSGKGSDFRGMGTVY